MELLLFHLYTRKGHKVETGWPCLVSAELLSRVVCLTKPVLVCVQEKATGGQLPQQPANEEQHYICGLKLSLQIYLRYYVFNKTICKIGTKYAVCWSDVKWH